MLATVPLSFAVMRRRCASVPGVSAAIAMLPIRFVHHHCFFALVAFVFVRAAVMRFHIGTPEMEARVVSMLTGFRTYMSYHIKATKSFLHARMRLRVDKLLQGVYA